MKRVAFVPIKFKSQRLENKNILPLGDKPLCWHIFSSLIEVPQLDEIYVFCSDDNIMDFIPSHPKIKFQQRPSSLDTDTTIGMEIYQQFIQLVPANIYVLAHATSPFLSPKSIQRGLEAVTSDEYDSAFSVKKEQSYCWYNNIPINYQLNNIVRTQELKPVLVETSGFYIFKPNLIQQNRRIGDNSLPVIVNRIEAIDIDEYDEYQLARSVLQSQSISHICNNNTITPITETKKDNIEKDNIKKDQIKKDNIRMVVLDFDGTISDGKVYYSQPNTELRFIGLQYTKCYNTKDGLRIKELSSDIDFYIISGNCLNFFENKAESLRINLIGNCDNKLKIVDQLLIDKKLTLDQVAFIGDDENDLPLLKVVGISGCPGDAATNVKKQVDYVCHKNGGEGAVREFLDFIFDK